MAKREPSPLWQFPRKLPVGGLHVGSTVWIYDHNRRSYAKPTEPGKLWGDLIFRESFRAQTITGETRLSWTVGERWETRNVNKRSLEGVYVSEAEVDDQCFVHEHREKIIRQIRSLADIDVLRQIAALVGYTG